VVLAEVSVSEWLEEEEEESLVSTDGNLVKKEMIMLRSGFWIWIDFNPDHQHNLRKPIKVNI
jgi:hypothetical protein